MTDKKITASHVLQLLSKRHSDDVFVPECKNGPTQTAKHRRLDAWVMKKSWSNPLVTGYEIKVSRSDFLSDDKWFDYLPYCNEFYFVCPYQMIKADELPAGVGLIWVSKQGVKLFKKAKAEHREVSIPEDLFRYILMARANISRNCYQDSGKKGFWEDWLKNKRINQSFGYSVSKTIREEIEKRVTSVHNENQSLLSQIKSLEYVRDRAAELGFNCNDSVDKWKITNKLSELAGNDGAKIINSINTTIANLEGIKEKLKE